MTGRTFVPFDSLWHMAIDVPYSFLVRDDDQAWSCGQLALDRDANVLAPHDLPAQSRVVADYVAEIIGRAGLDADDIARLVLFVDAGHLSDADDMRAAFHTRLSSNIILDIVPVPHFYYDGVVLEVDVFCGALEPALPTGPGLTLRRDRDVVWASIDGPVSEIEDAARRLDLALADLGVTRSHLVSTHWTIPSTDLVPATELAADLGLLPDPGAAVSSGSANGTTNGRFLFARNPAVADATSTSGNVVTSAARSGRWGWIQARSIDPSDDLVEQTRQIMAAIGARLGDHGVGFDAVVKATSLYVGGSSAAELHDNMSVRNGYYQRPGPASTGLPVFGLADDRSRIVVDVMYARDDLRADHV